MCEPTTPMAKLASVPARSHLQLSGPPTTHAYRIPHELLEAAPGTLDRRTLRRRPPRFRVYGRASTTRRPQSGQKWEEVTGYRLSDLGRSAAVGGRPQMRFRSIHKSPAGASSRPRGAPRCGRMTRSRLAPQSLRRPHYCLTGLARENTRSLVLQPCEHSGSPRSLPDVAGKTAAKIFGS
jgi:hypothetical protein